MKKSGLQGNDAAAPWPGARGALLRRVRRAVWAAVPAGEPCLSQRLIYTKISTSPPCAALKAPRFYCYKT